MTSWVTGVFLGVCTGDRASLFCRDRQQHRRRTLGGGVGLQQFTRLFATERFVASGWHILLFGVLFIAGALVLGFILAVFIDR